jgi:hypothetical protein
MCADIYRIGQPNKFLLLPRGTPINVVSSDVLQGLGHPVLLSTRELCDPQLSINTDRINLELATLGFCLHQF